MAQGNLDRETHEDRKPHHRSGLHLASVGPATHQENESQTSAPLPAVLIARPRASQSRLQNPPPRPQVNRYTTTSATTRQFFRHVKGMARRGGLRFNRTASSASPSPTCYLLFLGSRSPIEYLHVRLGYSGSRRNKSNHYGVDHSYINPKEIDHQ